MKSSILNFWYRESTTRGQKPNNDISTFSNQTNSFRIKLSKDEFSNVSIIIVFILDYVQIIIEDKTAFKIENHITLYNSAEDGPLYLDYLKELYYILAKGKKHLTFK